MKLRALLGSTRFAIPSLFTAASIYCAILAISCDQALLPVEAAWLICYSVLLDKLDGTTARLLGAQSRFGLQLDSAADLLAFGVAPAIVFYRMSVPEPLATQGLAPLWLAVALFYAGATARRLHRFNRESAAKQSRSFSGMPSTLAGALFGTFILACAREPSSPGRSLLPVVMIVLGLAMNAPYRTRKVTIPIHRGLLALQSVFAIFLYTAAITRTCEALLFISSLVVVAISSSPGREDESEEPIASTNAHLKTP